MKKTFLALTLLSFATAQAATTSTPLEKELDTLAVPADTAMVSTAKDKLYAIQTRYSPLAGRNEFAVTGGKNFNQDGSVDSNQYGAIYRYHMTDKWAVGMNYYKMNNTLSSSGKKLVNEKGVLPDRDYVNHQIDAMVEYNLFYGKMRFSPEKVVYFDQYWGVGAGQVTLGNSTTTAAVLDLGIAFWMGHRGSLRMGLKNDFYKEKNLNGTTSVHNMVGYLAFGFLFGGEG